MYAEAKMLESVTEYKKPIIFTSFEEFATQDSLKEKEIAPQVQEVNYLLAK